MSLIKDNVHAMYIYTTRMYINDMLAVPLHIL